MLAVDGEADHADQAAFLALVQAGKQEEAFTEAFEHGDELFETHFNALELAMKFNADVIFFLTDADEPGLTLGEMETIRRANNGAARIHCIEFGEGPDLKRPGDPRNFLQKLASESGGTYKYIDVKHLD